MSTKQGMKSVTFNVGHGLRAKSSAGNASCNPPSTVMTWPVVLLRAVAYEQKICLSLIGGVIGDLVSVRSA